MGRIFLDLLRLNRQFAAGIVLLSLVTLFALLSFVSPYPPNDSYVVPPDLPPSWTNLMGTTSRGQDLFWLLTFALRNTSDRPLTIRRPDPFDDLLVLPTRGGDMCCINDLLPSGAFDQSEIEKRDDVLVYSTAPLKENMTVIGQVNVKLWAISSAPDTDFTAKLVDVHPDGYAQNILDRLVRARYRRGSKLPPSFIQPGKAYEYEIELGNTSTVFKAGHRIRLEVSSSNFPHYVRNQNTTDDVGASTRMKTAHQVVLHDDEHRSYVALPVVPVRIP